MLMVFVLSVSSGALAADFKFTKTPSIPFRSDGSGNYYVGEMQIEKDVYFVVVAWIPSAAKLEELYLRFPDARGKINQGRKSWTIKVSSSAPQYQGESGFTFYDTNMRPVAQEGPIPLGDIVGPNWFPMPREGLIYEAYSQLFGELSESPVIPEGWTVYGGPDMGFSLAIPPNMRVYQTYNPSHPSIAYGRVGFNNESITMDFTGDFRNPPEYFDPATGKKTQMKPYEIPLGKGTTTGWAYIQVLGDPTAGNYVALELFIKRENAGPRDSIKSLRVYMSVRPDEYQENYNNVLLPILKTLTLYR
jgi:hypothetical protein